MTKTAKNPKPHPVFIVHSDGGFCGHQHATRAAAENCAANAVARHRGTATVSEVEASGAEKVVTKVRA